MARTQSLPGVNGAGHILYLPAFRSQSPSRSPSRVRTPRKPVDESFPTSPVRTSVHDFDRKLGTPGLHSVGRRVKFERRRPVLPPDIIRRFAHDSFWLDPGRNPNRIPVV